MNFVFAYTGPNEKDGIDLICSHLSTEVLQFMQKQIPKT